MKKLVVGIFLTSVSLSSFANEVYFTKERMNRFACIVSQSLKDAYTTYGTKTLSNPNPLSSPPDPMTPIYIKGYGPYDKNGASLYAIFTEYSQKVAGSISFISQAQNSAKSVKDNISQIQTQLSDISLKISDIQNSFNSFDSSVNDNAIMFVIKYF